MAKSKPKKRPLEYQLGDEVRVFWVDIVEDSIEQDTAKIKPQKQKSLGHFVGRGDDEEHGEYVIISHTVGAADNDPYGGMAIPVAVITKMERIK